MRKFIGFGLVSGLALVAMACNAEVGPGEGEEEQVAQSQDELKAGTGLLGSVCRACGCSYVRRVIDGCSVYRCECSTEAQAKCVVNAPKGATSSLDPGTGGTTTTNPLEPVVASPGVLAP